MASGADTSARMISLAFNIAVMGFVLVEGVTAYLRNALGITEGAELRQLAEKIAAGDTAGIVQNTHLLAHMAPAPEAVHAALAAGFGEVMVYGAVSVFVLAATSFMVFSLGKAGPIKKPA